MLPGVFVSGAGLSKAGPPRTSSFGPRCVCVCVSNSGLCEGNSGTPAGANLIGLRPRWPAPAGGPLGNGGGGTAADRPAGDTHWQQEAEKSAEPRAGAAIATAPVGSAHRCRLTDQPKVTCGE